MGVIVIDPGDMVVCDLCNVDFTESTAQGGFQFESKAVCPTCAPGFLEKVRRYGEEQFIRAWCPPGVPFADWVRRELR